MPRPPKDARYEAILERFNEELAAGAAVTEQDELRFTAPLVILGGLLRSGTTLLYQLLAASGSFVYPSNLMARFYRRPVAGWRVERLLEPFLPPRSYSFASDAGRTRTWNEPSELGYFWHRHLPFEHDHEPSPEALAACDARPIARELAALQSEDGRPLVVKNPILGFVYGWLLDRIPEARMVWLSRPPLAIAASIYRTRRGEVGGADRWWSVRPADAARLDRLPAEAQVAAQVRALLDSGAEARAAHPDRWLEVRYEAVCGDPAGELARIARFSGAAAPRVPEVALAPASYGLEADVVERLAGALEAEGVDPERPAS